MPDWFTHIVIALVFAEIFNVKKKSVVLLGAILPDFLPKLVLLELFVPIPNWNYTFLSAFHAPLVLFLVILLIAPLFRYKYASIVWWLSLGTSTHLLSDTLLRHFQGGISWLYPFSAEKYSLNLVWPDQSYLILIPALIAYIMVVFIKQQLNYHETKHAN